MTLPIDGLPPIQKCKKPANCEGYREVLVLSEHTGGFSAFTAFTQSNAVRDGDQNE